MSSDVECSPEGELYLGDGHVAVQAAGGGGGAAADGQLHSRRQRGVGDVHGEGPVPVWSSRLRGC